MIKLPSQLVDIANKATSLTKTLTANKSVSENIQADFPRTTANDVQQNFSIKQDFFIDWPKLGAFVFQESAYELVVTKLNKRTGLPTAVRRYIFNLPPASISFSAPVANNLSVLQNGIVEEHNAAPLRWITVTGTTGVFHSIGSDQASNTGGNVIATALNGLFANTIREARRFANIAQSTFNPLIGNSQQRNALNIAIDEKTFLATGYYDFHNLARFVDFYLALKKSPEGRFYRLHFNMYRDQMFYDVTIKDFAWEKVAGTVEYRYTLRLVAWRRRSRPAGIATAPQIKKARMSFEARQDWVGAVLETLRRSRQTLVAFQNVINGVKADIQSVFEIARQAILLAKDTLNVTLTVADMVPLGGSTAQKRFQSFIDAQRYSLLDALQQLGRTSALFNQRFGGGSNPTSTPNGMANIIKGINNLYATATSTNTHLSTLQEELTPSLEQLLSDPSTALSVFEQISLDDLNLTPASAELIESELERVRNLGEEDFVRMKQQLIEFSNSYAELVGGASETYSRVKNFGTPPNRLPAVTLRSVEIQAALNDMLISLDQLIVASRKWQATPDNDYYKFYVDFAIQNGLNLSDLNSKFVIPFPRGSSLEALALEYLGDPDRWPEIAALNALKPPYIDEEGYFIPLKSNGSGNAVIIAHPKTLFIGEIVFLQSNTKRPKPFKITEIVQLSPNEYLIRFDTTLNLNDYLIADNAKIHAFLPHTVNSQKLIAIPSDIPSLENVSPIINTRLSHVDALQLLGRTDFQLDSSGDLIITANGDMLFARGYANLVQAIRLKLHTPRGSIVHWPEFGNSIQVGVSTADFSLNRAIEDLNRLFAADDRFAGVLAAKALQKGPGVQLELLIGVQGSNVTIPISTQLP